MPNRSVAIDDLLRLAYVGDPQISPDGSQVIFTVKIVDAEKNRYLAHLWRADIASDAVRQFTYGEVNDSAPRWSPDGRQIAFVRTREKRSQIWMIPVDGGEARQLTKLDEGSISAPVWSPDGRRITFSFAPTHPDWTQEARKKRGESGRSTPARVIERLQYLLDGVGFLDCRRHIWVCDVASGEAWQITEGDYDHSSPTWSPDGTRIALVANRSSDPDIQVNEVDLWLVSPSGGELQKIVTPPGFKDFVPEHLAWSHDGSQIAYIGIEATDDPVMARNAQLWVVPVEGGTARCLTSALDRTTMNLTLSDTSDSLISTTRPRWSPDSTQIFFLASDQGACHMYSVGIEEQRPVPVSRGPMNVIRFSVDHACHSFAMLIEQPTQPAEVFVGSWKGDGAGLELRQLSRLNDPLLEQIRVAEPEEFWFKSADGTDLQGWLLRPPGFDPSRRYPLLLSIHGGPEAQYGYAFFHEFQVHAARGYVVLYTNPHGSMGREEQFAACVQGDWGNLDYQDILAAADYAQSLPYVDPEHMAVMGGSYGGYMTNWVVGHTDRFRCAITDRSVVNLQSIVGTTDGPAFWDKYWPGNTWDRPEVMWDRSPLRYAANIHTPLLIIHSEGDLRCPIGQAEELFAALRLLGREVVFVRYPPETSHGLSRNGPPDLRIDRLERIARWLDRYLRPDAD